MSWRASSAALGQISFWRQIPYNDNFRLPCPVDKNFCRKSLRLGQTTLRQNKKNSRNQTFLIRFYWKSEFRKFRLLKNILKFLIFYSSVSDKKIRIVAKNRYWRYIKQTKNAKKIEKTILNRRCQFGHSLSEYSFMPTI